MKSKPHKFTDSKLSFLKKYELSKATVFDVTPTETRESWKGSTKLPDSFVDTIAGIENTLRDVMKKTSSHLTIVKIYRNELERLNKDLACTKGILVALRGIVGVPTKGSDRNNLLSEIGDLRDMAHNLDKNWSDLTKRAENLDRNSASQDSLTEVISRVEYMEIEKGNNQKNRTQADAGDTNQKIFSLFEILIKKQGNLGENVVHLMRRSIRLRSVNLGHKKTQIQLSKI